VVIAVVPLRVKLHAGIAAVGWLLGGIGGGFLVIPVEPGDGTTGTPRQI